MEIIYFVLAALLIAVVWVIALYNGLIKLRNRVDEAWFDIGVQLKRRYDLIPNLVETVKGYAQHEKEIFIEVTKARSAAMSAGTMDEKVKAENMLSQTLKSLFAVAENYPQLKAADNFAKLQDELADTENKIQSARRFYNGQVRDFNTKIQIFPNNVMAGVLKFKAREFFEASEKEKENVSVKF